MSAEKSYTFAEKQLKSQKNSINIKRNCSRLEGLSLFGAAFLYGLFVLTPAGAPEKILYLSPELAPGDILKEMRLKEPLDRGVYDCTVTYYLSGEDAPAGEIAVDVRMSLL